ncbi:inovirus-type Gp2 protein [uncultured Photobacterium sp.]|uniref:YagK/YfjJ domain-containing protein n=1 Tax=uncultured Photobacterium sp. TaxID=173973 RepID=UPI0026366DED|nr:inovirus-type Gp2 protein [uncultured Photobacterium sp.]
MSQIILHESKKWLAYYIHYDTPQLIFYRSTGIKKEILQKGFTQLDNLMTYYSKVTVIFLQLHQQQFTEDNQVITKFLVKFQKRLKSEYASRIGYLWVREHNGAPAQHYHLAVMLNGHKCCRSGNVKQIAHDIWQNQSDGNYTYSVKNRIYRIESYKGERELNAARMRLSYFAKRDTKDFDKYTNSFGTSQLRRNKRVS